MLYRNAEGLVPKEDYEIPIGTAALAQAGDDITLVGWGTQVGRLMKAAQQVRSDKSDIPNHV